MRRARATARHRDPNVHVNPLKKRETKSREGREREGGRGKKVGCAYISADLLYGVWRHQTQIDPARFGFLGCMLPRELHDRKACDQFAVKG